MVRGDRGGDTRINGTLSADDNRCSVSVRVDDVCLLPVAGAGKQIECLELGASCDSGHRSGALVQADDTRLVSARGIVSGDDAFSAFKVCEASDLGLGHRQLDVFNSSCNLEFTSWMDHV